LDRWWEVFAEVSDVLPETLQYPVRFVPNEFIPNREEKVLAAFAENDLFNPDISAPIFNINGSYQHGGYISDGDILTIINPNISGNIYYTQNGTDPGIPGHPQEQVIDKTFVAENDPKKVLIPTEEISDLWKIPLSFDDSSWILVNNSPGGVGYERDSGYQGYISYNVESQMYNQYPGCYIRFPFQVNIDELPAYDFLKLKVRYDDGFVAYINGVEVERELVSGTPRWNSYASGNHEAGGLQSFDISSYIGLLQPGDNMLAIHGLNVSLTSSDFLICAELIAGHLTDASGPSISETAILYTGPLTLNTSTQVKARVLSDNAFSALNETIYTIDPNQ
jgi:hypothetical protein